MSHLQRKQRFMPKISLMKVQVMSNALKTADTTFQHRYTKKTSERNPCQLNTEYSSMESIFCISIYRYGSIGI